MQSQLGVVVNEDLQWLQRKEPGITPSRAAAADVC